MKQHHPQKIHKINFLTYLHAIYYLLSKRERERESFIEDRGAVSFKKAVIPDERTRERSSNFRLRREMKWGLYDVIVDVFSWVGA